MSIGFTEREIAVEFDTTPPEHARVDARQGDQVLRPFDSTIGDFAAGSRPFTLVVRAYVAAHPPGRHVFPDVDVHGDPIQRTVLVGDANVPDFKRRAKADIDVVWNRNGRGRLWLVAVDITRGYRGLGLDQGIPPPLKCLVDLQWTDDERDAHLRITLLHTGTNPLPRSNCVLGGRPLWSEQDMVMHDFQAGNGDWHNWQRNHHRIQPGRGLMVPFASPTPRQSVFAHEFGHYLGLSHPFPGAGERIGSLAAYGVGMGNRQMFYYIMGVGNDMLPKVTRPWRTQLVHHNYFLHRTFLPTAQWIEDESVREHEGWSLREPPVTHTLSREIQTRLGGGERAQPGSSGQGDYPAPNGNTSAS